MKGIIDIQIMEEIIQPLIGMKISHVWQGHGSAIFLEIGLLSNKENQNNSRGEYTIMIEDSWRVEDKSKILFGSWSDPQNIEALLTSLKGNKINKIEVIGNLPELRVQLSSLDEIQSFSTTEGDPQWSILLPGGCAVYSKSGKIIKEQNSQ